MQFSDGRTYGTDLAIICALNHIELEAVRSLPAGWQPLKFSHDETRYLSGTIAGRDRSFSVIAAAAPRMGMSASAVLTSKIIAQFRPRFVAMVGICAGRVGKVNLGDVIVADPTWDWGSGKIDTLDDQPVFKPSPHHIESDQDLLASLADTVSSPEALAGIKASCSGKKPTSELRVHLGPLASGASVVANLAVFEDLLSQHRNLLGIEMEAYGVATACQGSGKPRPRFLVVKSVCDFADKDKSDDFQEYAAQTSARVLWHSAKTFLQDI